MDDFSPLNSIDHNINNSRDQIPDLTTLWSTYLKLISFNPSKAPGPDNIPNRIFRDFADILAYPISVLLNSSFQDQKLPDVWKLANVTPVPKDKPVTDINQHLRPISLTCSLSKLAEEFIIEKFVSPAILESINQNQYGGVPTSSVMVALISMLHNWTKATNGTGNLVRVFLFDYRKAFDLIDHAILVNKICLLSIPSFVRSWIIDFLTDRKQRVKLAKDCFSEWGRVPCEVPQGTKLGPWLFILMINDLKLSEFSYLKKC